MRRPQPLLAVIPLLLRPRPAAGWAWAPPDTSLGTDGVCPAGTLITSAADCYTAWTALKDGSMHSHASALGCADRCPFRVAADMVPLDAMVVAQEQAGVEEMVTAAVATTAGMAGPGAATLALLAEDECRSARGGREGKLSVALHPLQFPIGGSYFLGCVVGNTAIFAFLVAVHVLMQQA
eukprot:gene24538-45782_t